LHNQQVQTRGLSNTNQGGKKDEIQRKEKGMDLDRQPHMTVSWPVHNGRGVERFKKQIVAENGNGGQKEKKRQKPKNAQGKNTGWGEVALLVDDPGCHKKPWKRARLGGGEPWPTPRSGHPPEKLKGEREGQDIRGGEKRMSARPGGHQNVGP